MATGARKDPFHGFNFRVELDRSAVAAFREVGGLSFNTDPVEYREVEMSQWGWRQARWEWLVLLVRRAVEARRKN